jgi:hypothetical protein
MKNVLTLTAWLSFSLNRAEDFRPKRLALDGARTGGNHEKSSSFFPIVLALGAIILAPGGGAQARDGREEGPTEIEKCQTISQSGSYKLVNNITAPFNNVNCLAITADFVTIDLAGFAIIGGPNTFNGVAATPRSGRLRGIAVRNGSIQDFAGNGVDLGQTDGSIVEVLRVSGGPLEGPNSQLTGIIADGIIKGNTLSGYIGAGMVAAGTITGNEASHNFNGIIAQAGSTVIGNTATDNRSNGIVVECPSNLTDNTAVNNGINLTLNGNGCNNTNNVAP